MEINHHRASEGRKIEKIIVIKRFSTVHSKAYLKIKIYGLMEIK